MAPPPTGPPASFAPPSSRVGPILLAKGSKRLLVLFIVLGVIFQGVQRVVFFSAQRTTTANISLIDAHNQLANSLSTVEQQQASCAKTDLACVQRGDKALGDAFATFANTEQSLSFSGGEQSAAATLQSNTRTLVALLDQLSTDNITQYTADETSLENDATNVDAAYQAWLDTTP
jgi:hypothetical protein